MRMLSISMVLSITAVVYGCIAAPGVASGNNADGGSSDVDMAPSVVINDGGVSDLSTDDVRVVSDGARPDLTIAPTDQGTDQDVNPSQLVASVQRFSLVVPPGGASGGALLRSAVDASKAVPFFSKSTDSVAGSHVENMMIDAYLTGPTGLAIRRNGTAGGVTIDGTVVEFGTAARVLSGTFEVAAGAMNVVVPLGVNDVDANRSFVVFWHQGTAALADKRDQFLRATIDSENLTLGRGGNQGELSGHWWVVESLDDSFSVQHRQVILGPGLDSKNVSATAVAEDKTFLLWSSLVSTATTAAGPSHTRCRTAGADTLRCTRGAGTGITEVYPQMITFTSDSAFVASDTSNLTINDFSDGETPSLPRTEHTSVVLGQLGFAGAVASEADGGAEAAAHAHAELLAVDRIEITRGHASHLSVVRWEAIGWPLD